MPDHSENRGNSLSNPHPRSSNLYIMNSCYQDTGTVKEICWVIEWSISVIHDPINEQTTILMKRMRTIHALLTLSGRTPSVNNAELFSWLLHCSDVTSEFMPPHSSVSRLLIQEIVSSQQQMIIQALRISGFLRGNLPVDCSHKESVMRKESSWVRHEVEYLVESSARLHFL